MFVGPQDVLAKTLFPPSHEQTKLLNVTCTCLNFFPPQAFTVLAKQIVLNRPAVTSEVSGMQLHC